MESVTIVAAVLAAVSIGVSLWLTYKMGKVPITPAELIKAGQKFPELASQIEKVGMMAVASADQLVSGEGVNVNEAKFKEAFDYVDNWSKSIFGIDLDPEMVKKIVEGSYKLYKERKKEVVIPSASVVIPTDVQNRLL